MPLTFGSTFAGIGGFDLAFARAGMRCLWQIEQNKQCQKVLAKHWPNVGRVDDVQDIERIKQLKPVDVISGGFPCQDLSVAGKRKGLAGERSGLWFDLHSVLRVFEPRWFVGENVPGLLSSNGGWDFAVLLGGLTRRIPTVPRDGWRNSGFIYGSWYSVAWRVLDARYFGLAQRRARVFIVASFENGSCAEILFDRESLRGDSASSVQTGTGIAATIRSRSANRGVNAPGRGGEDDLNVVEVAGCLQERDAKGSDINTKPGHLNEVSRLGVDVAGALQSHSERHGHAMTTQQAAESRHLVAMPLKASDPCHALHARAEQTTIAFAAGQGEPNADESGVAYSLDAGRGIQGVMARSNDGEARQNDDIGIQRKETRGVRNCGVRRLTPL